MDIEKNIKPFMFIVLALIPAILGFVFFEYDILYKNKIIFEMKPFSLIAICIIYTVLSVFIRILVYSTGIFFKDKSIKEFVQKATFIEFFYAGCVDVLIYSSIPIIITFVQKGNYIDYLKNTFLIWGLLFLYWIIYVLIFRNKQIIH